MQAMQYGMVSSEKPETQSPSIFLVTSSYEIAQIYMDPDNGLSSWQDTQSQKEICRKLKYTTYSIYFKKSFHKHHNTFLLKFHRLKS